MEKYSEFITDFENYLYAIKNLSSNYVSTIKQTISQFLDFINIYKFDNKFKSIDEMSLNEIRTITNQDVYSYVFYLADNDYKQGTRNLKIENLRTFFEFLYTIKHKLFLHPFQKLNTEKRFAKHLPNHLSYEEAKKMTDLYKNSLNELDIRKNAIIHLCLHCGMRISEVSNLNISDFKLSERKFLIFGKGNKERIGYLNNDTYDALIKYLEIRKNIIPKNKKDTDILFLSNKRTKMDVATIRRFIKKAYIEAGIDNDLYSVHTLRHTCATLLFKSGTDIKVIQEILGHSTVEVTKIYTHLYDKEVEQAMQEHPLSKFKFKDALAYAVA
jgi:site-specific recombinase XerD